jgi:hypothetical protein
MALNEKIIQNGTVILQCSCEHNYQDRTQGLKMRVHNYCKEKGARCTVCSKVKPVSSK